MLLMAWNTWRTIRAARPADYEANARIPMTQPGEAGR
jgi:cytochrome c oxidase cbb3-type subunit 1